MYLRFLSPILLIASAVCIANAQPLRICADPDNLPFSNRPGRGFDNRIAVLVAHGMGREPEFIWARSRRGFLREQFNKGACDVLMGVPRGMRGVETSVPYYCSSYVFVTARSEHLRITSFEDPHLARRRIGLQILEEDYAPPSLPLIRNGHAAQLVGFESFGPGSAEIVRAVGDGRIGAAVVWGPVAGYFAHRDHLAVDLSPVLPPIDASGVPFAFSLTIATHKEDRVLRDHIDDVLRKTQPQIDAILDRYSVPRLEDGKEAR